MNNKKNIILSLLIGLLVLPGCDWFKTKHSCCSSSHAIESSTGTGETLFSIKGRAVITSGDLEGYIDQIMSESPQVRDLLDAIPDAKYNLFTGLVGEELLLEWARENHIQEKSEYKKDYALALRMLERQIAQKYFQEYLMKKITVSEKEARDYYEANKDSMSELQIPSEDGGEKKAASRSFEEVRDDLVKMLQNEKASELYMQEMDALKKKYQTEENLNYFKKNGVPQAQLEDEESLSDSSRGRQAQTA